MPLGGVPAVSAANPFSPARWGALVMVLTCSGMSNLNRHCRAGGDERHCGVLLTDGLRCLKRCLGWLCGSEIIQDLKCSTRDYTAAK